MYFADKDVLRQIVNEILVQLAPLADKHDLIIEKQSVSYAQDNFDIKLNVRNKNAKSNMEKDYLRLKAVHPGLPELNTTFKYSEKNVKMVGANLRAHKYPFLVEGEDGKIYKLPKDAVLHLFNT